MNCAGCDLVGVPLQVLPEHACGPVEVPAVCIIAVAELKITGGVLLAIVELYSADEIPLAGLELKEAPYPKPGEALF